MILAAIFRGRAAVRSLALALALASAGAAQGATTGNVFVAASAPNPFRDRVSFSFTLPQSGTVSVEIFAADGRHVRTLAQGEMEAGPHNLTWAVGRDTPAGMYFYRVVAGDNRSTGKLTRVN